jgi:hypothetical protein
MGSDPTSGVSGRIGEWEEPQVGRGSLRGVKRRGNLAVNFPPIRMEYYLHLLVVVAV